MSVSIRPVRAGDEALIHTLLYELAEYEKLLDRFQLTEAFIARDYFGPGARLDCVLAHEGDKPAGIASWYWTYGSFAARQKLFLCDLFVRPEFRGKHYGRALIAHLARIALAQGAAAVEWEVLDWNAPSIAFYDGLGAKPVTGWIGYSLSGAALSAMAG